MRPSSAVTATVALAFALLGLGDLSSPGLVAAVSLADVDERVVITTSASQLGEFPPNEALSVEESASKEEGLRSHRLRGRRTTERVSGGVAAPRVQSRELENVFQPKRTNPPDERIRVACRDRPTPSTRRECRRRRRQRRKQRRQQRKIERNGMRAPQNPQEQVRIHRCKSWTHAKPANPFLCHHEKECSPLQTGDCAAGEYCHDYTTECEAFPDAPPKSPVSPHIAAQWNRCTPLDNDNEVLSSLTHCDICTGLGGCKTNEDCQSALKDWPNNKIQCIQHDRCGEIGAKDRCSSVNDGGAFSLPRPFTMAPLHCVAKDVNSGQVDCLQDTCDSEGQTASCKSGEECRRVPQCIGFVRPP